MNKQINCTSLNSDKTCKKLSIKKCAGRICSFYETAEQAEKSRQKANKRLCSIDADKQAYISNKYYYGRMPWKEA